MNIRSLKTILPILMKNDVVPFLWGNQGIGKTQTVKQLASMMGYGFIHLHLATQEVGDLVGLLMKDDQGNAYHTRPKWMPTEGNWIIFFDEANRAHPDTLQAMFSCVTEKTIHTHKLPPGCKLVFAGNYQSNKFNVTDTSDAAWLSRFCHIDVKPTVEEFCSFAESKEMDSVAAFIRSNPGCLETNDGSLDTNFIVPDRRAWVEAIGRLENEDLGDDRFEVYSGCVGAAAAVAFMSWKKKAEQTVTLNEILEKYDRVRDRIVAFGGRNRSESRFDALNVPVQELIERLDNNPHLLDEKRLANLKKFMLDIPLELSMKIFNGMKGKFFVNKRELLNDPEFAAKMVGQTGLNETT